MKRLQLPKNKFLRLLINIVLIVAWYSIYSLFAWELIVSGNDYVLQDLIGYELYWVSLFLIIFVPIFFMSRYIWFEKSRNRTFYGLFDKFNLNVDLKKFEPRIYKTTSNADELKKYADLRDQGIITEEEFQAKKKILLDL